MRNKTARALRKIANQRQLLHSNREYSYSLDGTRTCVGQRALYQQLKKNLKVHRNPTKKHQTLEQIV